MYIIFATLSLFIHIVFTSAAFSNRQEPPLMWCSADHRHQPGNHSCLPVSVAEWLLEQRAFLLFTFGWRNLSQEGDLDCSCSLSILWYLENSFTFLLLFLSEKNTIVTFSLWECLYISLKSSRVTLELTERCLTHQKFQLLWEIRLLSSFWHPISGR